MSEGYQEIYKQLNICPDVSTGLSELAKPISTVPIFTGDDVICTDGATIAHCTEWLKRHPPAIQGEGGDDWTRGTFAYLHDYGIPQEIAIELVAEWNSRCTPSWPDKELAVKCRNAYKYAKNPMGYKKIINPNNVGFGQPSAGDAVLPIDDICIDNTGAIELLQFNHDDLGNEIGTNFFYENARYVNQMGKWYIWDGVRWLVDEKLLHMTHIGHGLRQKSIEILKEISLVEGDFSEKVKAYVKWLRSEYRILKSAPLRPKIEFMLKADTRIATHHETFDSNLDAIGSPDGTIDLKTGIVSEPLRNHYITKLTGCSIPLTLPPPPMLWMKFLNEIFNNDQEMISFLQRLCGYILTGRINEEKLFFLYGKGANGKSNFLETIYYILGDYARRAPSTMFLEQKNERHPTELAGLKGARLVVGSELPKGKAWNEEIIKDLTGGDTITARLMRQDFFEYKPQFTLLIAGNHQPRIKSTDNGIRRRMIMIPFNVTIPEEDRDLNLKAKLIAEAPLILSWMVQGAVGYFKQGLNIPETVINASAEYIKNEDILGECINDLITKSSGLKVDFHTFFRRYENWMSEQGYNYKSTEPQLRKELKERDFNINRSSGNKYVINGYILKPEEEVINIGFSSSVIPPPPQQTIL